MSSNDPTPTQMTGQQTGPSSSIPHTPDLPMPGYAAAPGQMNSLAVVSIVAGVLSFFAHVIPVVGGFTVAIIAIVTGFIARGQIRRTGEQGAWMASVGIALGIIHLVLGVLIVLFLVFLIFVLGVALFGISAHGGGSAPSPVPSG